MTRKRRSPEEAKREILHVARQLVLEEGPDALKIKRVAQMIGISHPTILHHFGSAEGLLTQLQQDMALRMRRAFIDVLSNISPQKDRMEVFLEILQVISQKENGAILAFLLASGIDPFPPAEDKGLEKITLMLAKDRNFSMSDLKNVVLTVLLATYAESMIGDHLRARIGLQKQSPEELRTWMLDVFSKHLENT